MRIFRRHPDGSGVLVDVTERPAPLSEMEPIREETVVVELTVEDIEAIRRPDPAS